MLRGAFERGMHSCFYMTQKATTQIKKNLVLIHLVNIADPDWCVCACVRACVHACVCVQWDIYPCSLLPFA